MVTNELEILSERLRVLQGEERDAPWPDYTFGQGERKAETAQLKATVNWFVGERNKLWQFCGDRQRLIRHAPDPDRQESGRSIWYGLERQYGGDLSTLLRLATRTMQSAGLITAEQAATVIFVPPVAPEMAELRRAAGERASGHKKAREAILAEVERKSGRGAVQSALGLFNADADNWKRALREKGLI